MGFGPQKNHKPENKKKPTRMGHAQQKRPGTSLTNKRAEGPIWQTGKQSQGPEKKSKTSKQKKIASSIPLPLSRSLTLFFSFYFSHSLQTPYSGHTFHT